MKSYVFAICVENRHTALEPIIFYVSVFRFEAGKKARFSFHRVLGRFLRLLRLYSRNACAEAIGKTAALYIILNIEKGWKREIHFSV